MSWINKIFGKKEEEETHSSEGNRSSSITTNTDIFSGLDNIRFGRYSDNNKSYNTTKNWYTAEELFKEKKYHESFFALFEYLRDEKEDNVHFTQDGNTFKFDLVQGSKKINGHCDGERIVATVSLAKMATPSTAVMRRLLDLNYTLFYSRTAMDEHNTLCMIFDTEINSATPNKLYYGLRELATKADRQDDLLLADFDILQPADIDHVQPLPVHELQVKYKYFRKWIEDTLKEADALNQDSFSGAIAYLLLSLIYRIDFLITPESKLLASLEKISNIYWERKDEVALVERNKLMKDAIRKLLDISQEEFTKSVYRSTGTFSVNPPPKADKIKDNISSSNKDAQWYTENKYPAIAMALIEYGLVYSQFIYSVPRIITDLTTIFMAVIHADYFAELGMKEPIYNAAENRFNAETIKAAAKEITDGYADKYKSLKWDNSRIHFDSLNEFASTLTDLIANLNLETKR